MYTPIAAVQLLGYSIILSKISGLRNRFRVLVIDPKDNAIEDIQWARSPLHAAREGRHRVLTAAGLDLYEVTLWGSRPGTNDDCETGIAFETLAEARRCFDEPKRYFNLDCVSTAYIALSRNYSLNGKSFADELAVRQNPDYDADRAARSEKQYEEMARREQAMQAGMGMGIDAYNDYMGY